MIRKNIKNIKMEKKNSEKRKEAENFVNRVKDLVDYWKKQSDSENDKIDGLAFSILSELDGEGMNTYDLHLCKWNESGDEINSKTEPINGYLHELYYREEKKHNTRTKCELCGGDCRVEYWPETERIKSVRCNKCEVGPHASGDFSYLCGSEWCKCGQ